MTRRASWLCAGAAAAVLSACSTTPPPPPGPSYSVRSSSVAAASPGGSSAALKPTELPDGVTAASVASAIACSSASSAPPTAAPYPLTNISCTFGDEAVRVETWASAAELRQSVAASSAEARRRHITVYGVTGKLWTVRYDLGGEQYPDAPSRSRAAAESVQRAIGGSVFAVG